MFPVVLVKMVNFGHSRYSIVSIIRGDFLVPQKRCDFDTCTQYFTREVVLLVMKYFRLHNFSLFQALS